MQRENVILDLDLKTQDDCFNYLSKRAFDTGIVDDEKLIKEDLRNREDEMSTALLEPLAIPHAKSKSVLKNTIIFLRLKNPIDRKGSKVMIVVAIFSSLSGGEHLSTLASLSRRLVKKEFREFLETANKDEIYEQLKEIGE